MRIGVVFPQTELGGDAGAVRAWAQRAEELGFTHVLAYDHVVGADPAVHPGWDGPYDVHSTQMAPGLQLDQARQIVTEEAVEAGRDPASLGMEGRLRWQQDRDKLAAAMRQWQDADATQFGTISGSHLGQEVADHKGA